ncbi:hypothetical protein GCM10020001_069380 [Nonomuraea salmonea]
MSGPLKPGPKPVAISSYARRGSEPLSPYPSSIGPSFSASAGAASAPSTIVLASSTRHGRRATHEPSPAQPVPDEPEPRRNGTLSALTRWPSSPSRAGTSVTEVSTAATTEMPVTQPSVASSGNPASISALNAMITVPPANTTAPPELDTVLRTDSTTGTPCASSRRCRDSRNSA